MAHPSSPIIPPLVTLTHESQVEPYTHQVWSSLTEKARQKPKVKQMLETLVASKQYAINNQEDQNRSGGWTWLHDALRRRDVLLMKALSEQQLFQLDVVDDRDEHPLFYLGRSSKPQQSLTDRQNFFECWTFYIDCAKSNGILLSLLNHTNREGQTVLGVVTLKGHLEDLRIVFDTYVSMGSSPTLGTRFK